MMGYDPARFRETNQENPSPFEEEEILLRKVPVTETGL